MSNANSPWLRVIDAADCDPCDGCGELVCPVCEVHYADCACPGPHQCDEFEYRDAGNGRLEARAL